MDKHGGGHALRNQRIKFSDECSCTLDLCLCIYIFCIVSSPYLFVIGDVRVNRYTGADDDVDGTDDA